MKLIKKYFDKTLFYGVIIRLDHIEKTELITEDMIIKNQEEWYPNVPKSSDYIALLSGSNLSDVSRFLDNLQVKTTLSENLSIEILPNFVGDHILAISPALVNKDLEKECMEITIKFDPTLNPKFPEGSLKIPGRFKDTPEFEWPFTAEKLEKFDKENNGRLGKFISENRIL